MEDKVAQKFDQNSDKIAVVIKEFTLKKLAETIFERHAEPYIVSVAIDASGAANPTIGFNVKPFPNVRAGDKVSFDGQGHLIYGPKNPGEFLAYSILFMESDADIRTVGEKVEQVLKSQALSLGVKALLSANPTWALAATIMEKLMGEVAMQMKKNKDDELFRRNGTLLRDVEPAFDILRSYVSENEFIQCKTSIIPLSSSNMLGSQVRVMKL